jgi:Golgi nucleoside diphosphatase
MGEYPWPTSPRIVQKLEVPEVAKDIQNFDDKLPGFGVRKFAKGSASYFVKFGVGKQQLKKKTLGRAVRGNLQAMRLEASKILVQTHSGVDVVAERKEAARAARKAAQVKTLGELVPVYFRDREFGTEY